MDLKLSVVVWSVEPPVCSLCEQEGRKRKADKRVEVTLWHGAHGRATNYLCCAEHAAEWAAKMEGAAARLQGNS